MDSTTQHLDIAGDETPLATQPEVPSVTAGQKGTELETTDNERTNGQVGREGWEEKTTDGSEANPNTALGTRRKESTPPQPEAQVPRDQSSRTEDIADQPVTQWD